LLSLILCPLGKVSIIIFSIKHNNETSLNCVNNPVDNIMNYKRKELFQYLAAGEEIIYTYDVIYKLEDKIKWSTRWDHYLHSENSKIHWVSLLNSNIIVLVFTLLIAHIFCRALKKDIDYINSVNQSINI
jgi:hypothetical protein